MVAALSLVALALRLPGVVGRSLWLDEAIRANVALAPAWDTFWADVLGAGVFGAPMPPLFALVVRALGAAGGHSAATLRLLPLATSVLAVPLAFVLGRRLAGRDAGLAAATCFALYPAVLTHGQDLKPYAIDVALVLLILLAAERVVRAPADRARALTLALVAAVAPGFSYAAALVLPGVALALLPTRGTARALVAWTATWALAGAAALAWYVGVIRSQSARPLTAAYWAAEFAPARGESLVHWIGSQLLGFGQYAFASPVWLALAVALAGFLLLPRWFRIAGAVTLAATIGGAITRLYPLGGGRTSLFLVPFLFLPFGAAVAWLAARAARPTVAVGRGAAAAGAALLLLVPARGSLHPQAGLVREEVAPLVARLAAERQGDDRVYVYAGAVPAFRFYAPASDPLVTLGQSHRDDARAYAPEVNALLVPHARLWLLFSHVAPARSGGSERDVILSSLELYARPVAKYETTGASLHLYEVTRSPASVRHFQLSPEDMRDPERMRELLRRNR